MIIYLFRLNLEFLLKMSKTLIDLLNSNEDQSQHQQLQQLTIETSLTVEKTQPAPFIIINVQVITTASFFCFLILIIYFFLYFLSKIIKNFLECLFRIKKSKKVVTIGATLEIFEIILQNGYLNYYISFQNV
jgi:predicted PurR-regulated permease PerM